jgi:hypothetical protein
LIAPHKSQSQSSQNSQSRKAKDDEGPKEVHGDGVSGCDAICDKVLVCRIKLMGEGGQSKR